jgi:hypothetical protein
MEGVSGFSVVSAVSAAAVALSRNSRKNLIFVDCASGSLRAVVGASYGWHCPEGIAIG